jgi:hypothetical protein
MTATIDFGIPGVSIAPGDHICAMYFGNRERDEILMPFLRAGLGAGHKCLAVVDTYAPGEVVAALGSGEIDVDKCVASEQLQVLPASEAYLRTGGFATKDMIEFFDNAVSAATSTDGYEMARVTGETTWLFGEPPGADEFIDYESELNNFMPRYPQIVLCLYDLERFGGGMVVDLMKTHPKLILGGMLIDNPHYMSPEEFRASRTANAAS